jgi:membrane protein YdbS with pleckstrin-like domain
MNMTKPNLIALPGEVPSNHKEVLYWRISHQGFSVVAMNLLAFPLVFVFSIGFYFFVEIFGTPPEIGISELNQELLILLIGILLVLVLHELAHGIAMQTFGARPKYGFMWKALMFYATAPGYAFRRNQYIIVGLAPLVSLSVLACCGILLLSGTQLVWILAFCGAINGAGAIGDLWIIGTVLRYPKCAYIIDERDGMRIFLTNGEGGVGQNQI